MLAMKSAAAALLGILVLAVITPTLLHQDAGPGKPDDVAQVLPEETLAFVELVKAPKLLGDWKEYVGSVMTAEGKDKTCAMISEFFDKALEIVPEKLLKDLKEGLPSIQRMAVALTGMPDPELPWLLIATSSDPAFFKNLVETDLAVFAAEEKAHNGVKVFAIRKMGDLKSPDPVFVAASGARLFVTTRWASLTDALDRAAGKGTGGDLRKNRLYAQFAPAGSDDPALRAFTRWDWDLITGAFEGRGASYRRTSRFHMDMVDAVIGFRKIAGTACETTFKPGKVVSTLRLTVDSPCRIYDALRQPAGPKDLLAHLPAKTVFFVHSNLKPGKEIWADVENLVRRFQQAERKSEQNSEAKDYLAELDRHLKADYGVAARDIAAMTGHEIVSALVDREKPDPSFLTLVRTADPAKAREVLEAASKVKGKYTGTTEGKMTLYRRAKEDRACYGIQDSVVAFGDDEASVKEALKSNGDACGALKRLPKEAASASTVLSFNTARVIDLFVKASGEERPDLLKHIRPDDWSILLCRTEKDQSVVTTTDSGPGAIAQSALSILPVAAVAGFGFLLMGPMFDLPEAAPAEEKPLPEPAALPADALAKRTAELIPLLRSDDVTVREKASGDLRALGRQAIPLLVAAYKVEKDAEARSRLSNLLVDHKAWDALPDLAERRVDMFYEEFRKTVEETLNSDRSAYAHWNDPDSGEPWSMEPYYNSAFLKILKNGEIAEIPSALKRVAERLLKTDLPVPLRSQFAALLAFNDCGPAHEAVLQLRDASTDADSRAFFTVALGWSDDAKAKEAVYKSLGSKDAAIRRGAFLALERTRDPEAVTRLLDRTREGDFESRWNAGYTAGFITSGKLELNAFLPEDEFDAQLKAARTWWDGHKAGFTLKAAAKPK